MSGEWWPWTVSPWLWVVSAYVPPQYSGQMYEGLSGTFGGVSRNGLGCAAQAQQLSAVAVCLMRLQQRIDPDMMRGDGEGI